MTEKQLIERCSRQDRDAQKVLYETYAPRMLSLCARYVTDRNVAQDLMHDGFITVFARVGDFRHEGSFEGWMRRIFVNTTLTHLRRNRGLDFSLSTDDLAERIEGEAASVLEQMEANEVRRLIGMLPPGYRIVLNLHAIEGYSHKEIGRMLEISEGTSRSQYARAKNYLQKLLLKQGML